MAFFLLPVVASIGSALKIPSIAMFFGVLANTVLTFLLRFFTRKVAMNMMVIAMLIALTSVLSGAIYYLAQGLTYVVPSYLSEGFSLFIPDNAHYCVSVIMSARVLRWVWSWQFYVITKVAS